VYINIDINELAAEITRKIRDEISNLKIAEFGEVTGTTQLSNGGWSADVKTPAAATAVNHICLVNYIPKVGDWVLILHPPNSEPVLVDATPAKENTIVTPDDKYVAK
jgi:hypothetical protein